MATYYKSSGSTFQDFVSGNSMNYMNPTYGEANNNVSTSKEIQALSCFGETSQMVDVQDSCSLRNQEDSNERTCFPVMMQQGLSLGLSSRIETTQVMSGFTRTIHNSKYLKAAQQLLDEAVNVKKAFKQYHPQGDKIDEDKRKLQEPNTNPDIPQAERQELQNKLSKLLSILDEVDRRYKQYYHEMQIVVSSFDVIAGCGAAKPYTALALQTISRHFRCLRDAISGKILAIRTSLGGGSEHDGSNGRGVVISRLRNVDQHVRQQRALQRLGVVMQPLNHTWRPQRGLPDSSVMILRAWLFEHFLHPYPKDSDKIMLARQTGLSRGQVSNWFINARVRLWKPMVEEMYKEEFVDSLEENGASLSCGNTQETGKIQEKQTESSSNNFHGVARSDMAHNTVANVGGDGFMMMRNGSGETSLTLGIQNSNARVDVPMYGVIENYDNTIPRRDFEYLDSGNHHHDSVP